MLANEIDDVGADSFERAYWRPSSTGYHCLKVRPYDENSAYANTANGYTVSVFPTNAPGNSSISVVVKNAITGTLEPQGFRIINFSHVNSLFLLGLPHLKSMNSVAIIKNVRST